MVANVIEKVTLYIKHIIENAITKALVAVRAEIDSLKTKIEIFENSLIAAIIRSCVIVLVFYERQLTTCWSYS